MRRDGMEVEMNYNNSNAAYDLTRFMPQEQQKIAEPKLPAAAKQKLKKQAVRPASVVKWVFVSLFVMLSLASIMIGNIKITQQNDDIASAQKNLNMVQSEQVSLNAKLESRMSMQKVEDYATNKLGLVKIQPYQIQYVHFTDKDNVEVNGDGLSIEGFFENLINSVVEYF